MGVGSLCFMQSKTRKRICVDEMVEWPHQLHGHVFGQTPRDSEGQGSMLQSMGSQRVGHNLATEHLTHFPLRVAQRQKIKMNVSPASVFFLLLVPWDQKWARFLPLQFKPPSLVVFAVPWIVACQVLLSMELSKEEYWSGLPFPPPGDLPNPGMEPGSFGSPALASRFFNTSSTWEALVVTAKPVLICMEAVPGSESYLQAWLFSKLC